MFGVQVASTGQMVQSLLLLIVLLIVGIGVVMVFVRYHHLMMQDHVTKLVQDIHDKLDRKP